MIANNGIYGRHRILSKVSVNLIFTNFLADLGRDHGVGLELNQFLHGGVHGQHAGDELHGLHGHVNGD